MKVAPEGLNRISPMMCGTCAVEGAIKTACAVFMQKKRGDRVDFNELELTSCMTNESPGAPNIGVLSFNGGFHGRLFGALSATRTKPVHKVDFPAFDWPAANAPEYKYPLEDNEAYNKAQDDSSLAHVVEMINLYKNEKGIETAAVILEPIMSEGGDK